MIERLINRSSKADVLFLTGVVLSVMHENAYADKEPSVLPELMNTLGLEQTITLIKYFGGEQIRIPSHEEMHKSFLLLQCYYMKRVQDKSWEQIKAETKSDVNPHTLGKMIQMIDDRINIEIEELKGLGLEQEIAKLDAGVPS